MKRLLPVVVLALTVSPLSAQNVLLPSAVRAVNGPVTPAVGLGSLFDGGSALPQLKPLSAVDAGVPETSLNALPLPSNRPHGKEATKQSRLSSLDTIATMLSAQYGPAQWKKKHEGWDPDAELEKAKAKVAAHPNMTTEEFHDVIRGFFGAMKDYHVSVQFNATEASSLPFSVVGAQGRYFIAYVDRDKLPVSAFPFKPGDELVSFGGKPAAEAVAEVRARMVDNSPLTDDALAAMLLTRRRAASIGGVQQGSVEVAVKPRGSEAVESRYLNWDYRAEQVPEHGIDLAGFQPPVASAAPGRAQPWTRNMLSPILEKFGKESGEDRFTLGARSSYLPALGKKVWQAPEDAIFDAYTFKGPDGRTVGYVRIPSYTPDDENAAVAEFASLMKRFEKHTDALVIDQVNNPGGSVLYLYALASMLTDKPLATPKHRVAITQEDVVSALEFLKMAPMVQTDDQAKMVLGPAIGGYPVTYEMFRGMVDYSNFIVEQWKEGRTLTSPTAIEGVGEINPSLTARFTKPVMVLVNELDFSGGDFFPAILQDNKRAVIFGQRTAGAGGFVRSVSYPNSAGIAGFSMTGSIAVRKAGQPIENLGVSPDVEYIPTPEDFQGGFKPYANAVRKQLAELLPKKP